MKLKLNATTDLADAWDIDAGDDFAAVVRWKTGDTTLQGSVWTVGSRTNGRLGDNAATATILPRIRICEDVAGASRARPLSGRPA